MLQRVLFLSAVLFFATAIRAQEPDTSYFRSGNPLEGAIESFVEHGESEADFSEWQDELDNLLRRPVNLNGDENELRRLIILNEQQISNLLFYTQAYGPLVSIYELQMIEGFNENIVEKILPYISFSPYVLRKFSLKTALKSGHSELLTRYQRVLEKQAGFADVTDSIRLLKPNNYYLGDANALFIKYSYNWYDRFRVGFVAEKDAGETLLPKSDTLRKGFDYYSFHLFVKDVSKIKYLAIGDYRLQFGQGLTLWSGFSMGKTPGMVPMRKRAPEIRPHASSSEYGFLRGIASTVNLGKFGITGFYSNLNIDANISAYDSISREYIVSSIQETGYHRTPGELADRNAGKQILYGGHLSYNLPRIKLGITAFNASYDVNIEPRKPLYRKFEPELEQNIFAGFDYALSYKRLTLYGEISQQLDAGRAMIHGLSLVPDPRVSVAFIYRDYQVNYVNPFATAFGDGSNNTNERGLYAGVAGTVSKKITLTGYVDMFSYPWLKYRVDKPSFAREFSLQALYAISRRGDMTLRVRQMDNPANIAESSANLKTVKLISRTYFQWQFNYLALNWLKLKSRIYYLVRDPENTALQKGYFIGQDVELAPFKRDLVFIMRYSLFNTDSWDARIYVYENDLPYNFSIPAFSGKGSRRYAQLKMKLTRNIDCWLRYSQTFYSDRNEISSGTSLIQGNRKSDFKAAIKWKF